MVASNRLNAMKLTIPIATIAALAFSITATGQPLPPILRNSMTTNNPPPVYAVKSTDGSIVMVTNVPGLSVDLHAVVPASTNSGNWEAVSTNSSRLAPAGGTATMPFGEIGTNYVGELITTNGPVINVKALGADPTGASDSSAAFAAATALSMAGKTNRIYIPAGFYTFNTTWDLGVVTNGDSTFTCFPYVYGDGPDRTFLYYTGSGHAMTGLGIAPGGWRGPILKDFTLNGRVGTSLDLIHIENCTGSILSDLYLGFTKGADIYRTNCWRSQTYGCNLYTSGDSTHAPYTDSRPFECDNYSLSVVSSAAGMIACVAVDGFDSLNFFGGNWVGNGTSPSMAIQQIVTVTNTDAADHLMVQGVSMEKAGDRYIIGGQAHNGNGLSGNGWSAKNIQFNQINGTLSTSVSMNQGVMLTNMNGVAFFQCNFDALPATTNEIGFWDCKNMWVLPSAGNLSSAVLLTYIQTNGVPDSSANRAFFWQYTAASSGNPVPTSFGFPNDTAGTVSIGPVAAGVWNTNTVNAYLNVASPGNEIRWGNTFKPVYGIGFLSGSALQIMNGYATNTSGATTINYYTNTANANLMYYGFDGNAGNFVIGGSGVGSTGAAATLTNGFRLYESLSASVGKNNNAGWNAVGPGFLEVQSALFIGGYDGTSIPGNGLYSKGDAKFALNKGLLIKSGSNGRTGAGTLSGGTLTVSDTGITANSHVLVTATTGSAVSGSLWANPSDYVVGTSFKVNSSNNLDTNSFTYFIFESY